MIFDISSLVVPTGAGPPGAAACPAPAGWATARHTAIAAATIMRAGAVDFRECAMLSNSASDSGPFSMSLLPFCQWLGSTPGSIALHESLFMYPLIESVHVLTLCLFVGMTLITSDRSLDPAQALPPYC